MGMFDNVNYEAPCPKCGKVLKDWQSKDGPCNLGTVEPYEVDSFYTICSNNECKEWIQYIVKKDVTILVNKLVLYGTVGRAWENKELEHLPEIDLTAKYRGHHGRIYSTD